MHRRFLRVSLALALASSALSLACSIFEKVEDGGSCSESDECKSGSCHEGYCGGSTCACDGACTDQGSPSGDCSSGWQCRRFHSDGLFGLFASDSNRCAALCDSCPPGWACDEGEKFCRYDPNPNVTVSPDKPRVATGEAVVFRAEVSSPVGAKITSYEWSSNDEGEATANEGTYTRVFSTAGSHKASLTVRDDRQRQGTASASVDVCARALESCVNGGDTCCEGECVTAGNRRLCAPPCPSCPAGWGCSGSATACAPLPPEVTITVSPPNPKRDEVVSFHATATSLSSQPIASIQWRLGSDSREIMSGADMSQTFSKSGLYKITATAVDAIGVGGSATVEVSVCIALGESCSHAFSDEICCDGFCGEGTCKPRLPSLVLAWVAYRRGGGGGARLIG